MLSASVEDARQGLEGAPAHDHRLAHGDLAEIAEVARQPPRQVPAPANGAVLSHRHDQRDDWRARRGRGKTSHRDLGVNCRDAGRSR